MNEYSYLLSNKLDENPNRLHILRLHRITDHHLHMLLQLLKLRHARQDPNKQQVLALHILRIVGLYFRSLLDALLGCLVHLAQEKGRFHHVEYIKIVVHIFNIRVFSYFLFDYLYFSEFEFFSIKGQVFFCHQYLEGFIRIISSVEIPTQTSTQSSFFILCLGL